MACADENGLESVAFRCISTGESHFPNRMAAEIAVKSVKDYLAAYPDCGFKQVAFKLTKKFISRP